GAPRVVSYTGRRAAPMALQAVGVECSRGPDRFGVFAAGNRRALPYSPRPHTRDPWGDTDAPRCRDSKWEARTTASLCRLHLQPSPRGGSDSRVCNGRTYAP